MEEHPPVPILIWATDAVLLEALVAELTEAGRDLRELDGDDQLAALGQQRDLLLVAQAGPRLEAQHAFLRGPMIIVDASGMVSTRLASQAYAVVRNAAAAGLAVDRFLTHKRLAERFLGHRGAPRRCSRCGRGFDALKARAAGTAARFVRFGSISLCGACVEKLRRLVREADASLVEADV